MNIRSVAAKFGTTLAALAAAPLAYAQEGFEGLETIGKPVPGGVNLQPAVTEVARDVRFLDNLFLVVITAIVIFVMVLLAIVILRYNSRANTTPATFTHNSRIEVAWTVIPIVILIVIGAFSLPVLFKQLEIPEADLTVKVTGSQWFWSYEYPDNDIAFDSYMLERDELAEYGYAADEYLLATDTAVVVPVNKVVRLQITASDVIHAWKIPAFGVHMDAVPGRLNETWFRAERAGVYFGQCSELCGKDHSYMPITVKVVSEEQYAQWVEDSGGQLAGAVPALRLAEAD